MPEQNHTTPSAVIFGATSAVGQALAKRLASKGRSITLLGRDNDKLQFVADDLQARGAQSVHSIVCDLADVSLHAESVQRLFSQAQGELECYFFYGVLPDQHVCETDTTAALEALNTNFTSAVSWLGLLAAEMSKVGSGKLVVVTSVAGDRGRQSNFIYGAAKGGLSLYLQGLRNSLAAKGVAVITIKPGFIDTPMTAHLEKSGFLWAKPETIAADIERAVERGKDVVYTPWFWRYIMLVVKLIPERVFKKLSL